MSHYEERLERDLADLKERVLAVGAEVEEALRCAERVVVHGDRALASRSSPSQSTRPPSRYDESSASSGRPCWALSRPTAIPQRWYPWQWKPTRRGRVSSWIPFGTR